MQENLKHLDSEICNYSFDQEKNLVLLNKETDREKIGISFYGIKGCVKLIIDIIENIVREKNKSLFEIPIIITEIDVLNGTIKYYRLDKQVNDKYNYIEKTTKIGNICISDCGNNNLEPPSIKICDKDLNKECINYDEIIIDSYYPKLNDRIGRYSLSDFKTLNKNNIQKLASTENKNNQQGGSKNTKKSTHQKGGMLNKIQSSISTDSLC